MEVLSDNKKLYLFDFCDTLVNFQTADAYVNFVKEKEKMDHQISDYIRAIVRKAKISKILDRLTGNGMSFNKAVLLAQLKGLSFLKMDLYAKEYYETIIKPEFNKKVISELVKAKALHYTVGIVSGGFDIYIKYFADDFDVSIVITSELKFINGRFTGTIIGKDCMGKEKPRKIYDFFKTSNLKSIYSHIVGYTDSVTDLPFIKLCDEKVVITKTSNVPTWAQEIDARIINV